MVPRSWGMWEGGCSPCQQHHFEARRACGARLTSPTRWWWDLGTPLPCSRPAAGGRCVKPSRCIRRANPARRRCKKITRSVLKTASSCCFLNRGKHQSPSNPAPCSCTTFPVPCSRTSFPHRIPCTTLPHHALVPHSHTALPHHVPTPHSHTALPHHVLAPRSCTMLPHHVPTPHSCTTFLQCVPAPRSHTALLYQIPTSLSHTTFLRHAPKPHSRTAFLHRVPATVLPLHAPARHSHTALAPAPCSCIMLPHRIPAARSQAVFQRMLTPRSCRHIPAPRSRTAATAPRRCPAAIPAPCPYAGAVRQHRGRGRSHRHRPPPARPRTQSRWGDPHRHGGHGEGGRGGCQWKSKPSAPGGDAEANAPAVPVPVPQRRVEKEKIHPPPHPKLQNLRELHNSHHQTPGLAVRRCAWASPQARPLHPRPDVSPCTLPAHSLPFPTASRGHPRVLGSSRPVGHPAASGLGCLDSRCLRGTQGTGRSRGAGRVRAGAGREIADEGGRVRGRGKGAGRG